MPTDHERLYAMGGMWILKANKVELVSAETAKEQVRRVLRDRHGQEEVDRNEPLAVTDDGDTWLVQGAATLSPSGTPDDWMGPLRSRVAKFDAQILAFIFEGDKERLFAP